MRNFTCRAWAPWLYDKKMKTKPLHIVYLSGFGGRYDSLRKRALGWWRFPGVTTELVPMRWEGNETFAQKQARVNEAIDRVAGKRVVLVGESAGASMAVHVYADRAGDLHQVMGLCGKAIYPETVRQMYYDRSPAFKTAMEGLNDAIERLSDEQKQAYVSIHPLYDPVVPVRETLLPGCKRVRLWSVGHQLTIALGLTLLAPLVVRAARR